MKIVHVIDYFQPQLGYQETFLPREQAKLGYEVCVITSDRYAPGLYSGNAVKEVLGERVKGSGLFEEEGIKVWRLKTLFEIPHGIWVLGLEKKIRELQPDIIIVHGIASFHAIRIARLKKKQGNFKLIYDDHMQFVASRSKMRVLYPAFKHFFSPLIQRHADAIVGIHNAAKTFMNKKYGIPLERIEIIPLGADDNRFRFDGHARNLIRKKLSINENDVLFIYTGKLIPAKGPHLLVQAALELMKDLHNIKLMLIGGGVDSYVREIKKNIRNADLENRFIWHSSVPNQELLGFYSASDVAVWPRESSLSMLEAMACNLPVIISDKSEVTERIGYGNGLTYRGDDALDLAQQMKRLLAVRTRKEMGSKGRKLIEEKLNWRIIAKQFIELVSSPEYINNNLEKIV